MSSFAFSEVLDLATDGKRGMGRPKAWQSVDWSDEADRRGYTTSKMKASRAATAKRAAASEGQPLRGPQPVVPWRAAVSIAPTLNPTSKGAITLNAQHTNPQRLTIARLADALLSGALGHDEAAHVLKARAQRPTKAGRKALEALAVLEGWPEPGEPYGAAQRVS